MSYSLNVNVKINVIFPRQTFFWTDGAIISPSIYDEFNCLLFKEIKYI